MASYVYQDGTGWVPLTASQLPASGVAAGSYGDGTHVGRFTVDAHGIITAASSVAITGGGGGGGSVLDYVEQPLDLTVNATSAATADVFIPGNAHTYNGSTDVKIEVWTIGAFANSGAVIIELYDGSTDLGRIVQVVSTAPVAPNYGVRFLTPTAAPHTYSLRAWKTNGGASAFVVGSSGGVFLPAWYRITST